MIASRAHLTVDDLDAGRLHRIELVDGEPVFIGDSTAAHGAILGRLNRLLDRLMQEHRGAGLPEGRLSPYDSAQIPLRFRVDARFSASRPGLTCSSVSMMVELLSEANRVRSLNRKVNATCEFGAQQVSIIDPEDLVWQVITPDLIV